MKSIMVTHKKNWLHEKINRPFEKKNRQNLGEYKKKRLNVEQRPSVVAAKVGKPP